MKKKVKVENLSKRSIEIINAIPKNKISPDIV